MGEVIQFRRAPLTGFIPETIGADDLAVQHAKTRAELAGLVDHAKLGQPNLYEPIYGQPPATVEILPVVRIERNGSELPCDCGPDIA